ncbi:DUF86 domain-containing protein [Ferroacidibacillus organovorans]|uniref:DUF86 domain-containing protein n=1 Tax=Ferroacidibacillus organovorans TaxID=1765683 RepID=UPI0013652410|nr:HepT-like ribonuclease domain-containing protein [Ferroacidibacillus organovorans]
MFITEDVKTRVEELSQLICRYARDLERSQAARKSTSDENVCRLFDYASARCIHGIIESFADAGNQLIDALIMRDPASYRDIVEILGDESVIPPETVRDLGEMMEMRRLLIDSFSGIEKQIESTERIVPQIMQAANAMSDYVQCNFRKSD